MLGTIVNAALIAVGGLLGVMSQSLLPDKMRETLMQGVGLFVLLFGVRLFLGGNQYTLVLIAIVVGGLLGEWVDIEGGLNRFEGALERRLAGSRSNLSKGFIYASLVFGIGPMAITGAIADGLAGDSRILLTKAVIDGIAATAFAAAMGPGVILSALTILIYQGGLSLLAASVQHFLPPAVVVELTAVGGLLVFGIGVNMLEWRRVRVPNFLPALLAIIPLVLYSPALGHAFRAIFKW